MVVCVTESPMLDVGEAACTRRIDADFRPATFAEILQMHAARQPDNQAFVFLGADGVVADETNYSTLDLRARAIACELIINGLAGKRVLLIFPPGLDFIAALFGCFYAGAVAVPVSFLPSKYVVDRISSIIRDADPGGVLTLKRVRTEPQIHEASNATTHKLVWIEVDTTARVVREVSLPASLPEALALIQYTSGSTSSPKGVMLTHGNLIANSAMIAEAFEHDTTGRGVGWLPLFHDMGLVGHVLQPVYGGVLSVLMSPLLFLQRPALWLRAISTWKATTSGGPTYAFEYCSRAVLDDDLKHVDLSSWRVAYCGAEKIRADVLDRFSFRFAKYGFRRDSFLPCYGLAEATLLVTGARLEAKSASPGTTGNHLVPNVSCGRAPIGSSIVIADPETKVRLDDDTVGEIWVQGAHVGQGYWRLPESADDSFGATLADGSGPYLRTGDLGCLQAGELLVVGRIKDTIIINGLKHNAEDIESCVARSHEIFAGTAGAAFGIEWRGQERAVFIQEIRRTELNSDELAKAVTAAFAAVTRELGLRLFDLKLIRTGALPRTSSGKVRRSQARETYLTNGFKRLNRSGMLFSISPMCNQAEIN
jgi:acyl-CoA synthetase (AMP-forming)/AMP-acid ligase II